MTESFKTCLRLKIPWIRINNSWKLDHQGDAATRKVLQDGLDKANKNIKKIEDLFEPFGGI